MVSIAPGLSHEDDGVAVSWEAIAGEVDVVADALRAVAVVAHAVQPARRVAAQAGGVDGRGDVASAGKSGFDGGSYLVHADHVDHVVRPPSDGGNAVTTSVDIDDDAILGDGISAGKKVVHIHRIKVALAFLFGRFGFIAVNNLILTTLDEFTGQPHLTDGL